MFFFPPKKSLEESHFFQGFTDWHCHLLPGVDDGVKTLEESLQVLAVYERLGIREAWLTPHIMEDIPNKPAFLRAKFEELQAAYTGPVRLHLAAENMLDNLFEERLEANDLLPLCETQDHLLVETSYFNPPMNLYELLARIRQKGYYPVLAHPERYVYMGEKDYRKLKALGVKFQLNLPSLYGFYGKVALRKAQLLLRYPADIDFTGTDTHSLKHIERLAATRGHHKLLNVLK